MEEIASNAEPQVTSALPEETTYWAVYDPLTGSVLGIYPGHSADDKPYKILIETFIAQHIQESVIQLNACFVDPFRHEFVVMYDRPVTKIDDVLHRVPNKNWSALAENDVYIEYNKKEKTLNVALTERFYGTRSADFEFKTKLIEKHIFEILLLITDYNDPNVLHQLLRIDIADLIGKEKMFYNLNLPDNFSVYTKRFFKNYILEIT